MAKIVYEFDSFEDREELIDLQNVYRYKSALCEIYNISRGLLKYEDLSNVPEKIVKALEEIKILASENEA